jgi:hypothetical protein
MNAVVNTPILGTIELIVPKPPYLRNKVATNPIDKAWFVGNINTACDLIFDYASRKHVRAPYLMGINKGAKYPRNEELAKKVTFDFIRTLPHYEPDEEYPALAPIRKGGSLKAWVVVHTKTANLDLISNHNTQTKYLPLAEDLLPADADADLDAIEYAQSLQYGSDAAVASGSKQTLAKRHSYPYNAGGKNPNPQGYRMMHDGSHPFPESSRAFTRSVMVPGFDRVRVLAERNKMGWEREDLAARAVVPIEVVEGQGRVTKVHKQAICDALGIPPEVAAELPGLSKPLQASSASRGYCKGKQYQLWPAEALAIVGQALSKLSAEQRGRIRKGWLDAKYCGEQERILERLERLSTPKVQEGINWPIKLLRPIVESAGGLTALYEEYAGWNKHLNVPWNDKLTSSRNEMLAAFGAEGGFTWGTVEREIRDDEYLNLFYPGSNDYTTGRTRYVDDEDEHEGDDAHLNDEPTWFYCDGHRVKLIRHLGRNRRFSYIGQLIGMRRATPQTWVMPRGEREPMLVATDSLVAIPERVAPRREDPERLRYSAEVPEGFTRKGDSLWKDGKYWGQDPSTIYPEYYFTSRPGKIVGGQYYPPSDENKRDEFKYDLEAIAKRNAAYPRSIAKFPVANRKWRQEWLASIGLPADWMYRALTY